jgi:hypothetical protein
MLQWSTDYMAAKTVSLLRRGDLEMRGVFVLSAWVLLSQAPALHAAAPDGSVTGKMNCRITSNSVIATEDGKPVTYSGYSGAASVGDTLEFSYFAHPIGFVGAQLTDLAREEAVWQSSVSRVSDEELTVHSDGMIVAEGTVTRFNFSEDHFFGEALLFGRLSLSRYYKSDWQGIYVHAKSNPERVQVITLDCRTVDDQLSSVVDVLREK